MKLQFTILSLLLLTLGISNVACTNENNQIALTLAPESTLPDFVITASPEVQEAYRFAMANPEILKQYPCYCGCKTIDHMHNLDCYVKQFNADGSIDVDPHALV